MQPFSCILYGMATDDIKVFKALADLSRRQLIDRLRKKGGLTLSELCEEHDMSRQAVTKHLVLLEAANLVVERRTDVPFTDGTIEQTIAIFEVVRRRPAR